MDRSVPVSFALLGLLLGAESQLAGYAPVFLPSATALRVGLFLGLLGFVTFLVGTVGAVVLGWWTAPRDSLPDEYGEFTLVVGVSYGVGALVGAGLALVAVPISIAGAFLGLLVSVGYHVLTGAVSTAFLALAGAAVGYFGRVDAGTGAPERERKT
ncbi:hypothetical protein [Halospeciosus flavus]|uniref:DUF5518 domain-containing protein n=1 Tax=Halospeciosus flavus TaxID=3032283 RepID=A0ABD5Z1K9_9EURY|nr:hypothetical protein [Halospeciosus flavus]